MRNFKHVQNTNARERMLYMKNVKRLLCGLVILSLCLSMCSVQSFAFYTPTLGLMEEFGHEGECYMAVKDCPLRAEANNGGDIIGRLSAGEFIYINGLYQNTKTLNWWVKTDDGYCFIRNLEKHIHEWKSFDGYDFKVCMSCYRIMPTSTIALSEAERDEVHIGLAVMSLIPQIGNFFDLADGILCLQEGDFVGATISLFAAIPALGVAFDAIKAGQKTVDVVDEAHDIAITIERMDSVSDTVSVTEKLDYKLLRQNMNAEFEASGYALERFNGYNDAILPKNNKAAMAAHHIVGNSKEMSGARYILESLDIDINSALNGVFLCGSDAYCLEGAVHAGGHSKAYYQTVNQRIVKAFQSATEADKRGAVINELNAIAEDLMSGKLGL